MVVKFYLLPSRLEFVFYVKKYCSSFKFICLYYVIELYIAVYSNIYYILSIVFSKKSNF